MARYFTSDLHFGHANIIKYCKRPFSSVEEMDEALIDNWNAVVNPDDDVWILGDLCMGRLPDTLGYISLLAGRKILLPGNHDPCWVGHKGWRKWASRYVLAGVDEVIAKNQITMQIGDRTVLACHFPYVGDHYDERYVEWRPKREGMSLVHGHIHEKWRRNGPMVNVGVDVWDFRPVHEDELAGQLR